MKRTWLFVATLAVLPVLAANAEQPSQELRQQIEDSKLSTRQRVAYEKAAIGEQNLKAGAGFLAANRARPGVTTLPSGVQYRILKAGAGSKPVEGSTVLCLFKGELTDGSVFDRSDEHKPSTLQLAGLVPGLREALKLMPVGSRWEVVVPPELAYGDQGDRAVGANAVLIYQVELVAIR